MFILHFYWKGVGDGRKEGYSYIEDVCTQIKLSVRAFQSFKQDT